MTAVTVTNATGNRVADNKLLEETSEETEEVSEEAMPEILCASVILGMEECAVLFVLLEDLL